MFNKKIGAGIAIMFILILACSPKSRLPLETSKPFESAKKAETMAGWEAQWENIVAAGKKEGKVSVYSSMGGELRSGIGQAFKDRFGISVEFFAARATEVSAKILSERRSSLYLADAVASGPDQLLFALKPNGALLPLDGIIILPEVLNKEIWYGGEGLRFIDKEHYVLRMLAYTQPGIIINTNLIRTEEVTSYKDLLNPRWKGKIVMGDPTAVGPAGTWFRTTALKITGPEYLKELARQEPVILRDDRLPVEWLAKDKHPLGLALRSEVVSEFIAIGAPLKNVSPIEGVGVTSGGGCIALMNNAPHPNAAAVFINWLLTREGQTIRSRTELTQSARLDVPTDHLEPAWRRDPKLKYFDADDEKLLIEAENARKLARDIFEPVMGK